MELDPGALISRLLPDALATAAVLATMILLMRQNATQQRRAEARERERDDTFTTALEKRDEFWSKVVDRMAAEQRRAAQATADALACLSEKVGEMNDSATSLRAQLDSLGRTGDRTAAALERIQWAEAAKVARTQTMQNEVPRG